MSTAAGPRGPLRVGSFRRVRRTGGGGQRGKLSQRQSGVTGASSLVHNKGISRRRILDRGPFVLTGERAATADLAAAGRFTSGGDTVASGGLLQLPARPTKEALVTDLPTPAEIDPATRRRLAIDLFNRVWTLLETPERTPDQDDEMLHAAHASRYHWGEIGVTANRARGEWQCSRVYAVLGRAEPALWHARRCLALCETHGLGDWDLAAAYEALARASAVAGDRAAVADWTAKARTASAAIADREDREIIEQDLAALP